MFFGTLHPVFCKCPSTLKVMAFRFFTDGLVGINARFC
jgi:hypothetical protein